MEMFSQNLENEKNLVCVLGRAERMPRETATAKHLGRMRALGSSSPALRLPHQKPGARDYLPWGSSQPTRLFKWVEGWWDLSFNCYDMTYVTPSFIIHFHLKRITGQIFTWDIFFNCQYFNIFTKCTLWNVWISFCFVLVRGQENTKQQGMNGAGNSLRVSTQLPASQPGEPARHTKLLLLSDIWGDPSIAPLKAQSAY